MKVDRAVVFLSSSSFPVFVSYCPFLLVGGRACAMEDEDFTVFVRLPIPRGDFVDPPPVSLGLVKLEL